MNPFALLAAFLCGSAFTLSIVAPSGWAVVIGGTGVCVALLVAMGAWDEPAKNAPRSRSTRS